MRALLRSGLSLRRFTPVGDTRSWEAAAARLRSP
jgi:hypothetical protein